MWRLGRVWLLWVDIGGFFAAESFLAKSGLPYAQQGGAVIID